MLQEIGGSCTHGQLTDGSSATCGALCYNQNPMAAAPLCSFLAGMREFVCQENVPKICLTTPALCLTIKRLSSGTDQTQVITSGGYSQQQ